MTVTVYGDDERRSRPNELGDTEFSDLAGRLFDFPRGRATPLRQFARGLRLLLPAAHRQAALARDRCI